MGDISALDIFLNIHKDQLISSNVPQHFWQVLHQKLVNQTFDAGRTFQILKLDYDEERKDHEPIWALQVLADIDQTDSKQIYLIDHAWTYQVNSAKQMLMQHDSLRERLCNQFDLSNDLPKEKIIENIFEHTWKVCNYYSIGNAENIEDRLPIWYIMDEIGTAILHSDNPNCRVVPFVYLNEQITYSLLFPIKNIEESDLIYRDFAEGVIDPERRSAILLPWVPKSFEHINIIPSIPDKEYYLSGHIKESLPILSNYSSSQKSKLSMKVFTQYNLIKDYLTNNKFITVETESEADVLWYTEHFRDFRALSETPEKFVNQFPFEYVLTVKDLLCMTCRHENSKKWLPITYNLVTEITNFVACFQNKEKEKSDNFWIIKPYNLARGLDIHITNNLNYIMRLAVTGPKIVQKYITNPVLFYRPECYGKVKFDIRFSNVPFALNEFDNYEKHFTVMNYTENANLKHMKCAEFKINWALQYSDIAWETVEKSIIKMLKDILESATVEEPPRGIAKSPQSRALYAADIMLEWVGDKEIKPQILEINFIPDCKRACDYYPDFYNDIFNLLFMNNDSEVFLIL